MMLTEEQAKEKWCPLARVSISAFGSGSVGIRRDDERNRCIASQCMAWRWNDRAWEPSAKRFGYREEDRALRKEEPPRPDGVPGHYVWRPAVPVDEITCDWIEPEEARVLRRRGYCGAFGAPTA